MITKYFILNNYVEPKFIHTKRKNGNSTYFYKGSEQYLVCREGNYIYGKFPDNCVRMFMENDGSNQFHSHEAVYKNVNGNFEFLKYLTFSKIGDCGFEDPRCITWNNDVYLFTNRRNLNQFKLVQMHIGKIDDNIDYIEDRILSSKMTVEKNWQPIETMPGICSYAHNPFSLVNVFDDKFGNITNYNYDLCGSSQVIKVNDKYLSICHKRNEAFEYLHYFVLYDNSLNILKVSPPFSFFGANIEFNTHLEMRDSKIVIIVSVHDQIIYEFTLNVNLVFDIIDGKLNNATFENKIFTKFYNDALTNNNIFGAIGLAMMLSKRIMKLIIIEEIYNNLFKTDY